MQPLRIRLKENRRERIFTEIIKDALLCYKAQFKKYFQIYGGFLESILMKCLQDEFRHPVYLKNSTKTQCHSTQGIFSL